MARITPRSINIREIERAADNAEWLIQHLERVMNAFAEGIIYYEENNIDAPDEYIGQWLRLETAYENGKLLFEVLRDLAMEL